MNSCFELISKFFSAKARQEPIIIARVTIAMSLFLHYLTLWQSVQPAFEQTGFVFPARSSLQVLQELILRYNSSPVVSTLYFGLLISAIFFACGFFSRLSGVFLFLIHSYFYARNEYLFWGWGDLIRPFLFYVICSDPGKWYSVDALLKKNRGTSETPSQLIGVGWPTRLIQIHLTTLYIVVAWTRLDDPNWRNGSMVYGILCDPLFSRFDFDYSRFKATIKIATFISWITELSAPFLFWVKSYRRVIVVALWSLHAGLEVFTLVGYWNYLIASLLFTFWFEAGPE